MANPKTRLVAAFVVVLGAWWLRVHNLNQPDYWSDEAYSLYHLRSGTLSGLFQSLSRNEETPPVYFLALVAWTVTGRTEFYVRALSALLGTVAVAGVIRLGRTLGEINMGCVAGGLLATSYLAVILSRQARAYALGMVLVVAVIALTFKLIAENKWRHVGLWVLASALCISTNYLTGVIVAASWLSVLVFGRLSTQNIKRLTVMAAGVSLVGLGLLPLLLAQTAWSAPTLMWIPPPSFRLVIQTLDEFTVGAELRGWPRSAVLMIVPALSIVVVLGAYWIIKRRIAYSAILIILFMPLALIYLVSFRQPIFLPRYTFAVLPALCLVLAAALKLAPARMQWVMASVVGLGLLSSSLLPYPFAERIPWSAVAAQLKAQAQSNDGLIFSPLYNRLPFELKYDGPDLKVIGVQDYADYAPRAGQVAFAVGQAEMDEFFSGANTVWVVEDKSWPLAPLSGWTVTEQYDYPGALLIRYQRVSP